MKESILTVDFGTSSVKAVLVGIETGEMVAAASSRYSGGKADGYYAELDARSMWEASVRCVGELVEKQWKQVVVKGITFSFFGDNLLICDRDKLPIYPIILCSDKRGQEETEEFVSYFGKKNLLEITGGLPDTTSIISSILWLSKYKKDMWNRTGFLFSNQQYILDKLNLEAVNDETMAFRKSLLNVCSGKWETHLLHYLQISEEQLGKVIPCGQLVGEIRYYGNVDLKYVISVFPGVHDCNAGLTGVGLNGETNHLLGNVTGTYDHYGYYRKREKIPDYFLQQQTNNLIIGCGCTNDSMVVMGAFPGYGTYLDSAISILEGRQVDTYNKYWRKVCFDKPGPCMVSPNTNSMEFITQKNLEMDKYDLFQAVVEGLTFESRKMFEYCVESKKETPKEVRIGGGPAKEDKWNQLRADIMNIPYACVQNSEVSSIGASVLAAYNLGYYTSLQKAAEAMVHVEKIYVPDKKRTERYEESYQKRKTTGIN